MIEIVNEKRLIRCCDCNTQFSYTHEDIELLWLTGKPFVRYPVCGRKLFCIY